MRISVARDNLARLISQVARVVESRNNIPVLSCVRMDAADGKLTARGTDLDIAITASVDADVEPGSICVDAKLLADIAKKAPADTVTLELDGCSLKVKSGRSRFTLQTLPAEDWPDIGDGDYTAEFTADLAALFAPVQFAISTEETRFYLNGVFLHTVNGRLAAVATDGHRLARNLGTEADEFKPVIVPRKTAAMLPAGDVKVELGATKMRITAGTMQMVSKFIDGTFPDYQRVIPANNERIVTVDRDGLRAAVDRVSVVANERGSCVRLSITSDEIAVSVRGGGEGVDTVPCLFSEPDGPNGEPLTIGFNSKYVVELLGNIPAGDIEIALADPGSPALLRSKKVDDALFVLMPMRVS